MARSGIRSRADGRDEDPSVRIVAIGCRPVQLSPMIYSNACEYGIRAATHLAARYEEGGLVKLRDIVEVEDIPAPFLSQILQRLVGAGLLRSTRGPTGGYGLSRPPSKITLHDIKAAVDGVGDLEQCAVGLGACSDRMPCPLHNSWQPIRQQIRVYLRETTLEQMAVAMAAKVALLNAAGAKPGPEAE